MLRYTIWQISLHRVILWLALSHAQLSIICLEVELCSRSAECSGYLVVEFIHVGFELALSLRSGQIEWESLIILNFLSLFFCKPNIILLVHEVTVPSLVSEDTEVLDEFQRIDFGDYWSSCLWGHVGVIVFEDVACPFFLKPKVIEIGLRSSLIPYMLGDKESWCCEINPGETLSSSDFENPVVGVETQL